MSNDELAREMHTKSTKMHIDAAYFPMSVEDASYALFLLDLLGFKVVPKDA
jgi:hypothetical protein